MQKPPKTPAEPEATAEDDPPQGSPGDHSLEDLAQDWITLWQSEMAALVTDRETQESWRALFALWAGAASAILRAMPRGMPDVAPARKSAGRTEGAQAANASERARAARAKRAAPAAAPPDVRDAEIDRLNRCIAELERRLADVERRAGQPRTNRRSTRQRPRER